MAVERQARAEVAADGIREPRLVARLLGDWFFLAVVACALVAAVAGWVIFQKANAQLEVPPRLWVYAGAALFLAAGSTLLRVLFADEVSLFIRRQNTARDADSLVRETRASLRDRNNLSAAQAEDLGRAAEELDEMRRGGKWELAARAVTALDEKLEDHLGTQRKSTVREYVESILIAVAIAFFLRAFVFEAFKIPSGSMIPTLQVGDHIFVNKFIYGVRVPWTDVKIGMGLRKPQRGEVVVFKYPIEPSKDFIKRIIGLEGDTVEVKDRVLYVNGKAIPHVSLRDPKRPCEYDDFDELTQRWEHRDCEAFKETLNGHVYTTFFDPKQDKPPSWPRVTVPKGKVFVMGDNRDNSSDSRYWGTVPLENLRGKAMVIWWSLGAPEGIRVGRLGKLLE